jgi:hypothetical protein
MHSSGSAYELVTGLVSSVTKLDSGGSLGGDHDE